MELNVTETVQYSNEKATQRAAIIFKSDFLYIKFIIVIAMFPKFNFFKLCWEELSDLFVTEINIYKCRYESTVTCYACNSTCIIWFVANAGILM